jgi:hypothetical protein
MNGMKRLLSVVAILILAGALLPVQSQAAYRGAWAHLTTYSSLVNGSEQGSFRPGRTYFGADLGTAEGFFSLSTRSLVPFRQKIHEIHLHLNRDRAGLSFAPPSVPLIVDPATLLSYADPSWSPDGHYLAYVKTDENVTYSEIWVQEFELGASSTDLVGASTPVGSPILIAGGGSGILNRHPQWSPDGNSLTYDSNASHLSIDVYTQQVFPSVGAATRITFNDVKAEVNPTWSPDGSKIAYASNKFGQFLLFVLDLSTVPNPTDGDFAEANPAPVTHANPKWSWVAGDNVLYYDAPAGEDQNAPPSIWRLDLNTGAKCGISVDERGAYQVDVSHITNLSGSSVPFNYLLFSSTALNLGGIQIWRGNYVNECVPPLPMAVSFTPASLNVGTGGAKNNGRKDITVHLSFPPETQAAGYQCLDFNGPREGVKMRTIVLSSPLMEGLEAKYDPANPGLPTYNQSRGSETMDVLWDEAPVVEKILALGLVGQPVPMQVNMYSSMTGRRFSGYGYMTVVQSSLAGSSVRLSQNSPNPFNPQTKITFVAAKPGNVDVRIFNARGELVKTLARQWFPQGEHTLTWDGRTDAGVGASSGMYFAVAKSLDSSSRIKMMLMK